MQNLWFRSLHLLYQNNWQFLKRSTAKFGRNNTFTSVNMKYSLFDYKYYKQKLFSIECNEWHQVWFVYGVMTERFCLCVCRRYCYCCCWWDLFHCKKLYIRNAIFNLNDDTDLAYTYKGCDCRDWHCIHFITFENQVYILPVLNMPLIFNLQCLLFLLHSNSNFFFIWSIEMCHLSLYRRFW